MTGPLITDHTFRGLAANFNAPNGSRSGIQRGMCAWRGMCNRPREDHITVPDFRAQRAAGAR